MKPILIGNWKMNGTKETWRPLARNIAQQMQFMQGVHAVVCPPPPAVGEVAQELAGQTHVALGAQSVHHQEAGAYTGGVSAPMLASLGTEYVMVGHSERRKLYVEEQGTVLRLQQCWHHGMTPMLCVGESLKEHEEGKGIHCLDMQLQDALYGVSVIEEGKLVVAYEPVWAISSVSGGKTAEPKDLEESFRFIRAFLVERFGDVGYTLPIVYGGSVNPENAAEYMNIPEVQGLMVGAASLDAVKFVAIAQAMAEKKA